MRLSERQFQRVGRMVQVGRDAGDQDRREQAERERTRGPRQATSITMATARNSAVNSMVGPRQQVMRQSMINSPIRFV